jgi:hypothetical protein
MMQTKHNRPTTGIAIRIHITLIFLPPLQDNGYQREEMGVRWMNNQRVAVFPISTSIAPSLDRIEKPV